MPGRRGKRIIAGVVILAATIAGCGGDGGGEKLPSADSEAMLDTINSIGTATASEDCDTAQSSTTELRAQIESLPDDVDPEIVEPLNAMVTRVDDELEQECADTGTTDETTTTEETTTEVPTTTVPTTTETTTTEEPPPEEDDDEEPETPEQPPGEGGGPQGPKPTPPGQSGGGPPTGGLEEEERRAPREGDETKPEKGTGKDKPKKGKG